jgi:hypothetical protein
MPSYGGHADRMQRLFRVQMRCLMTDLTQKGVHARLHHDEGKKREEHGISAK